MTDSNGVLSQCSDCAIQTIPRKQLQQVLCSGPVKSFQGNGTLGHASEAAFHLKKYNYHNNPT